MAAVRADRNLLLGILALQMDFISREQLVAATSAWLIDKSQALEELLVQQNALSESDRDLLVPLVLRHIANHGGEPEQSLAAVSSLGSLRDELQSFGDADVERSLLNVAANHDAESSSGERAQKGVDSTWAMVTRGEGSRFCILRPHAKGGLGEVSVATDTELNREVAVKEIQSQYADDPESRSRFVLEAEVTGGLEHPGIVPVYGLGQYDDGRPYYAMRFIRGDSLKAAANQYHKSQSSNVIDETERVLQLRKLLGRFVDVCNAIEYAHSRGVLHRDLKPGNIMLGKYGETLVVDWGLAKLKDRNEESKSSGEATLKPSSGSGSAPTQMGSALGTPAYMPPEQAAGKLDELGPQSDVYSLGATLYYVLTGQSPSQGNDIGEVLRKVQAGDIPTPRSINSAVPKPLEAICQRAMSVHAKDRYASPRELADDVERYLADEPVSAHAEPMNMRVRRWIRKHPTPVAALVATILVGSFSAASIATIVAGNNQELATANKKLVSSNNQLSQANDNLLLSNAAERAATAEATRSAEESKAVLDFLQTKVLATARPADQEGGLGINATIRAAIDAAEPEIAEAFKDQPLVEASIRFTLGVTYHYLGQANLAMKQHERSLELHREQLGLEHFKTLASMNDLALSFQRAGRLDEALPLFEEILKIRKENLGEENSGTLTSKNNLALAYKRAGSLDEAIPLFEETLKFRKEKLGPNHPDTLISMNNLAAAFVAGSRLDEALLLFEETLKLRREHLGPVHPDTLTSMNNLGSAFNTAGRLDEALQLLEKTLRLQKEILGMKHPSTLTAMNNLALGYESAGRLNDALPLFEETLMLRREKLGTEHPDTLLSMNSLALSYKTADRLDESLSLFKEKFKLQIANLGPKHLDTLMTMGNIALVHVSAKQWKEAIPIFQDLLKLQVAILGPEEAGTLSTMAWLASSHKNSGRYLEAVPILEELLLIRKRKLGPKHSDTISVMTNLAFTYKSIGKTNNSLKLFEEAVHITKSNLGTDHPDTVASMNNLAFAYNAAGRLDDAMPLYEETMRINKESFGAEHIETLNVMNNLAFVYASLNRRDKSRQLFKELVAGRRKLVKMNDPGFANLLATVSYTLLKQAHYQSAETNLRESLAIYKKVMPDHWVQSKVQSMLGEALTGQKKFNEAEPLLLNGYESLKNQEDKIPKKSKFLITESLQRLVNLYTAWEKQSEAAKWEQILDENAAATKQK